LLPGRFCGSAHHVWVPPRALSASACCR
jgi:hypothetical protein